MENPQMKKKWILGMLMVGVPLMGMLTDVWAQDASQPAAAVADAAAAVPEAAADESVSVEMFTVNNTWMMVATFLVFIMHLGFATLETGLTRAKNSVNILFKNTAIIAIGLLTYAICGFNLMYPGFAEGSAGWFGFAGIWLDPGADYSPIGYAGGAYTYWTDFLFQGMFAATAATIVSGAVAERVKLSSFLIFTVIYVAVIYPIVGSWKWGGGWLDAKGFYDFAGSTLVHSVGGWAALAGVIVLGPRLGKYVKGNIRPIMGHNMPLATIGAFLLWLGWFGFNGGSVLSADPEAVSFVLVTTCLAAAAGIMGAMLTAWVALKKPDLSMALNGALAGLVGITAGADVISPFFSVVVGLIAGVLVVFSVLLFDKAKLDDPVGALSVHLTCGIWGTLAVGIFGYNADGKMPFMPQLLGVAAAAVVCFISAFIIFFLLKMTIGLRVSEAEELGGLDIGEHGMEAYSGFQIFSTQ
ncbi:MAG: Amt family ammonium transporter [Candidatus Omnitrophota bacterium]|jgi:Amt family ammonium transporter